MLTTQDQGPQKLPVQGKEEKNLKGTTVFLTSSQAPTADGL